MLFSHITALLAREEAVLFKQHFIQLRKHPSLINATIVVFQEANKDWQKCLEIYGHCYDVPNTIWVRGVEGQTTPGVWTSEMQKEIGVHTMGELIDNNRIHFAKSFFTHAVTTGDTYRGYFVNQLRAYERILKAGKGNIESKTYRYSGKAAGKDDVATSAILCLYWLLKFESTPTTVSAVRGLGNVRRTHPIAVIRDMMLDMESQYISIASRDEILNIRQRQLGRQNP